MKRVGSLYQQICSLDNLLLADAKAQKGKAWQYGVRVHNRNREANILALHYALINKTYSTSPYTVFKIFEPKEREIYRLPYYPDRIVHHAVMNVLEPLFVSVFTTDTYSCIKNRGIHAAHNAVKKALCDAPGTQYYLKLDIKKFYPSIDHDILKALLRRKIKDQDLLWLLDGIINSADGLPIGNYLSQYLANFYLTYFDHWVKEVKRVKYYFRYADDIVVLSSDKTSLHQLIREFGHYLSKELKLQVKPNWRIAPVCCGLDFVGYVYRHTHTRLRKTIKQNFARMLAKNSNPQSIASYWGWMKHCNANHLTKTLLHHDQFQIIRHRSADKRIHRRQNKVEQNTQPADQSSSLQNREVGLRNRERDAHGTGNRVQRKQAHSFYQLRDIAGYDQASTGGQISIHYGN